MSRQATKTKQEKAHLSLAEFPVWVETPALNHAEQKINKVTVDYESIAYAEFDAVHFCESSENIFVVTLSISCQTVAVS
jgi:hypothetical protein